MWMAKVKAKEVKGLLVFFACIDPKPRKDKGNEVRVICQEPEDSDRLLLSLECSGQAF